MDTCACVNTRSSIAQRLLMAGWQPATRSTPLPTVADGHRQPYDLYSSIIPYVSTCACLMWMKHLLT